MRIGRQVFGPAFQISLNKGSIKKGGKSENSTEAISAWEIYLEGAGATFLRVPAVIQEGLTGTFGAGAARGKMQPIMPPYTKTHSILLYYDKMTGA